MGTLEALVAQITALSGDADLPGLQSSLKSAAQDNVMRASAGGLLAAVAALDAAAHSLGCLYLLEAKARTANAQQGDRDFLESACTFLPACTPRQVRMAPEKFVSLCRAVKAHCLVLDAPKRGVAPLRAAVAALCPSTDHLSPIHADFFQLCLLSKCYSAAGPVLDADVYTVDPAKTAVTPTDVLLYCYYGGLLEIGRRRYAHALELLLTALTAPTMVPNAITAACAKKYMLVSLIHSGAVPQLPKYAAPVVSRMFKSECAPYAELAKLCGQDKSPAELSAFAVGKQADFEQDGNMGLVGLAIEGHAKRQIQKLTQTYLTLSLADIAQQAGLGGPAEAEVAVLRMIDAGEVHARISERDGMIRFSEEDEAYHSEATTTALESLIARTVELAGRLQTFDMAVSSDRAYLTKTELKGQRSKESGDPSGSGAEQLGGL
ncbi:COP9 signalosome complex subunit 3 [Micractinium conductrix]|uniref:COP9 signalosome complex subunit 3 n=1 Tax=Micractinium conductrix TaxID=554055 RepID=A0A2P6VHG3_9CHLO|nr:COP9 signalosome complex subunit 3 [Micractinium conductrix]|eukprot:PSC73531.1 COP9 signalosome complex subunit 3 [Micractinium conductrix]